MTSAYWWSQVPNFGDQLTPLLLKYFSGLDAEWAPIEQAEVVAVGSILEHIPNHWAGHVIGTGRIKDERDLSLDRATIHAVRGPLSARGLKGDFALGDAGLLANELIETPFTRDVEVGVIPHWSDTDLINRYWVQQLSPLVISPWLPPLEVIAMIGRCKKVIASSLHGVIIADAFGIPRRTEEAPRFKSDPREGNFFKFRDYNASVGVSFETGKLQEPKRGAVQDRQSELYDAFTELGTQL
jgi:polysaccharide pyruvyl transferase